MPSILNKTKRNSRPPAAVEFSPEGILAAALVSARARRGPAIGRGSVYAFAPLAEDALVPSIEAPNFRAPEAVAAALRTALDALSLRKRALTLILPDPLVRVFVLDFDAFPAKPAEAVAVARFRLRKMVSFDVEQAGVSCQLLAQNGAEYKVLAAIVPGPILAEYESAVRAAGYEPGAVLSSSLAALEATDSTEGILAASLAAHSITTAVALGDELLLYRTLDLPPEPWSRAAEIARAVAVAAAYFEDKLGAPPRALHYAGILSPAEFTESIANPALQAIEWTTRPEEGALSALPQISYASVQGALAGAS